MFAKLYAMILGALLVGASPAFAVESSDATSTGQLEMRANLAFDNGEYNIALPIFKQLSVTFKDEPSRVEPLKEKMRVCERAIASLKNSPATQPATAALTSGHRKPHAAARPGEILEIEIKDLGNFDYDAENGGNIPADVTRLNGTKIRVHGFMIPMDQAVNVTQFALVPSLGYCCQFGQPPQIQHTILVDCPKGKAVGYCPDEIIVEGKLKVEEKKDGGYIVSIFGLDVTSVKPAPR